MVKQDPPGAIRTTLLVTVELEKLGVAHAVGGSLASSLYGVPRATNDADIVAAMREEHVDPLVAALEHRFYVDADMIRDAIAHRHEFNVIELDTMFKVDVFVPPLDTVIRNELRRARTFVVDREKNLSFRVASPEDTIAHKLEWFQRGERVSERQWSDAIGVLVVQKGKLDLGYLREVAELMNVSDLLEKALREAASSELGG